MNSKIAYAADYRGVKLDIPAFSPDMEAVNAELGRLARRNAHWTEGRPAAGGDIAECRLESALPRFSKERARIVIGSGMFDERIESALTGRAAGDSFELSLDGEAVRVSVLAVKNRVIPEPDDAMAAALGIEGVHTLADYSARVIQSQRSEACDGAVRELFSRLRGELIEKSGFLLRKEDWKRRVELELGYCRVLALQEGLELEKMTPEQFVGRIPVKSYYELVAMLQDESWDKLCDELFGRYYAESDGFRPSGEGYEKLLDDYSQEWHLPVERARAAISFDYYSMNAWCEHAYSIWTAYIQEQYHLIND